MQRDTDLPPRDGPRSVLGCRVSDDVQNRFKQFVGETYGNRQGAYGLAVEYAMEEFMDNDRYNRIESKLRELNSKIEEGNALTRRLVTAEKEKGAFLEASESGGNSVGDRRERENRVVMALAGNIKSGNLPNPFIEDRLNEAVVEVAEVSSAPSKRDYRESMMDRGLLQSVHGAKYRVTEAGFELWERRKAVGDA